MRPASCAPLLLLVLAGCLAPGADPAGTSAQDPANAWLAAQWGDARELVLVDETFTVSKAPQRAGGVFTPGERLVLPGTERVEVLLTWDEGPGAPDALELLYDGGGTAGRPEEVEVRNGEPAVLPGEGATDSAYQPHSHWWFGAFPLDATPVVPETTVRMHVVAHRSAVLPVLAAPSPRFGMMLDHAESTNRGAGPLCPMCEGTAFSSAPGAIVTDATKIVRATIAYEGETDAPGIVAWTPTYGSIEMVEVEEDVWEVEPPAEALDSPYQAKSLWWFFLVRPIPVQSGTTTLTVESIS